MYIMKKEKEVKIFWQVATMEQTVENIKNYSQGGRLIIK